MYQWIISKIVPHLVSIILGCISFAGIAYMFHNYIDLRVEYKQARNTIEVIQKEQFKNDKLLEDVEKRQSKNFDDRDKALIQMHEKGFITHDFGRNPSWMCKASPDSCKD